MKLFGRTIHCSKILRVIDFLKFLFIDDEDDDEEDENNNNDENDDEAEYEDDFELDADFEALAGEEEDTSYQIEIASNEGSHSN